MAIEKKDNSAYRKLRESLKNGEIGPLYVFFGEESYLKRHCLGQLKNLVCAGFEEFNYEFLEGERLSLDTLEEAVSTLPMGSERKLVVVRDMKLPPAEDMRERLIALFSDMPQHACLVFLFEAGEYKPDKRMNFFKVLETQGSAVEFVFPPASELTGWLRRRFSALGKQIGAAECEHMLFLCGYSMTNLATEVEKIAAATPGERVTKEDVDALASRVLEADVFELTDAVLDGKYARALAILRDLVDLRSEPVAIHAALTRQLIRLYGAKLARSARKSESETAKLLGLRHNYPAKLMLERAGRVSVQFARKAVQNALETDVLLKSNLPEGGRTLELFLMRLALEAGA